MISNKKADMSIQLIIVAAIALIVLVVMIFIFSSKINIFGKGVSTCQGVCVSGNKDTGYNDCQNPSGVTLQPNTKYAYNPTGDCGTGKVCCNAVQVG